MNREIELDLRSDFLKAYKVAQKEYRFKSPIFIRMLNEHGAYETARRLTNTLDWQKGYEKLAYFGRTDLTVEHIILQDKYAKCFSERQLYNAKEKIRTAKEIEGHSY